MPAHLIAEWTALIFGNWDERATAHRQRSDMTAIIRVNLQIERWKRKEYNFSPV
jgi:hypothetical protein